MCDSHGLWIPLKLAINVIGRLKCVLHLLGICSIVGAAQQIVAYALEIVSVCKVNQGTESFDLKEQVHSLRLFVVVDELWNDLIDEIIDVSHRLVSTHASLVLLADLAGKAPEVLVTPAN